MKLPTRFEMKSVFFGANSTAAGDASVTFLSTCAQSLFAPVGFVAPSDLRLVHQRLDRPCRRSPEMLMLASLPGVYDAQPKSTFRKSDAAG